MNAKQTASVVALIAAAHPQWPATPETVAIYGRMLGDLPYEQVVEAVRDLLVSDDRWPSIAAIRRRHFRRMGLLAPDRDEAWDEVYGRINSGGMGLPKFSHPAIDDAIRTLGFRNVCYGEMSIQRAHFWKVYDETSKRHDTTLLTSNVGELNVGRTSGALTSGEDDGF